MLKLLSITAICLLALAAPLHAQKPEPKKSNPRPAAKSAQYVEPFEKADAATMAAQCVRIHSDVGEIALELFPESAPESVRNFLNLASLGAFDTTTFSRVIADFIIQGGSLSTRGTPAPNALRLRANRSIPDEPSEIKHVRGILSMARPEEPNSASSHFFIVVRDSPFLDGKYSAFGRVTSGMEVVDEINKLPGEDGKPAKPVRITKFVVAKCEDPAVQVNRSSL
jgi:peptidyl-prolyl cis-trans isomerase B (cyclophilin B)